MSSDAEHATTRWVGQVPRILAALVGLALAGPVLSIAISLVLIAVLLCGCAALIMVAVPFTAFNAPDHQAQIQATASLEAEILTYPLPANVEFFVEARSWNFSPNGEYVLLRVNSSATTNDQAFIRKTSTGVMRQVKLSFDLGTGDAVWLDERRLFIFQSRPTQDGYGFILFSISDDPNFEVQELWLPPVRADKATVTLLDNKDLFQNMDSGSTEVVAIDETGGWVIDAYDPAEQQALEQLMADRKITRISFYVHSDWRTQESYNSPDGNYYAAVWSGGERLAILRPGGEIAAEAYAADFGPADAYCALTPIRWLPNSRGVLFSVGCDSLQRAILLLSIPNA